MQMDFKTAVITCFTKYIDFDGRASRSEMWWFVLACFLAGLIVGMIAGPLGAIVSVATLLPSLAVGVRRLHDIGKSGWWILIGFIPLIGWIIAIYWAVQPSAQGSNEYGEQPAHTLAA
jgi:uncharacterized membrane protein YhaH (DUF805 family)